MSHQLLPDWYDLLLQQAGVVSRRQALAHGLTDDQIENRLRCGKWQSLHRGVHATFTGPANRDAQLWAAVLRAGPMAALSHQTAAELNGLADEPSELIHLTVPVTRHPGPIQGLRVHRSVRISATTHPVRLPPQTRVAETVVDLTQAAASRNDAYGWLCRAIGRRLTTDEKLRAALDARPKLRWRASLLLALDDIGAGAHSLLEYRYVRDVERSHGLPPGRRQAKVCRDSRTSYLDNLYDAARLAVELDGQVAHAIEERWADIQRDNAHAVAGIMTLRYSWADIDERPCSVAAQVAAVLSRRGMTVPLRRCGPACTINRPGA
jgi:hypothetical protein